MSDKPLHIDKKFTDQAWAGMRNLLDQEMPVPPGKRRRFMGFWWLGLVAVGLLVGAGYLFFGKKTATPTVTNQPIAGSVLPQFPHQIETSIIPDDESIASEELSAEIASTQAEAAPKIQSSNTGNKPKQCNSPLEKMSAGTLGKMNHQETEAFQGTLLEPALQLIASAAIPNASSNTLETPIPSEAVAISGMEPLPNYSIPAFAAPINNDIKVQAFLSKKPGWDWAIQANAIAVPNLTGGGFSVGVVADKYLLADKLSFEIGVGYAYLRQPVIANTFENSVFENASDNIIYENADLTSFDASGIALTTALRKNLNLHYLTVPIQINYCFAKRVCANVGFNTGILLSSPSDYTQDGILNANIWRKQSDFRTGTASKVSILDAAVTAGLGFRCSKSTSLHLDYLHGLRDVLPENHVGDYNRVIKIGVRIKLKSRY
ncbi:MAG: PorT family protein [Saprospiraceae bacterium]|nr:PorT family protein [Saprospiraceae bacterium]MCF8249948.1 PorT family protein [Saprospiraceae bacterium]MCF8279361.1 PorT family protein [Bacteroidales bacterium]MCF8310052.1 PorT family protein [Saprospiraceae bacterium]MCF8438952.1 PorT family protein [Saprospiraceae bacterium]